MEDNVPCCFDLSEATTGINMSVCFDLSEAAAGIIENIRGGAYASDVLRYFEGEQVNVKTTGWINFPNAYFVTELNNADNTMLEKHIVEMKKILTNMVYNKFVYDRFTRSFFTDMRLLFKHKKGDLRRMIKMIVNDIILNQICIDGTIKYNPRVLSMCLCIYIVSECKLTDNSRKFLMTERLFKKYTDEEYVDVKLSRYRKKLIFSDKSDPTLLTLSKTVFKSYNMSTFMCFAHHQNNIAKVLAVIKTYFSKRNMISIYKYNPRVNNIIYFWWMCEKLVPRDVGRLIVCYYHQHAYK